METELDDTFQLVYISNKLQRDRSVKIKVRNYIIRYQQKRSVQATYILYITDKDLNLLLYELVQPHD